MLLRSLIIVVMATAATLGAGERGASAQVGATVRISSAKATVTRQQNPKSEVVAAMPPGTVLDVLDRDGDWYWVLLPRNENGTRLLGYIRLRDVEAATADPQLFQALKPESSDTQQKTSGRRQKKAKPADGSSGQTQKQKANDDRRLERARREFEKAQHDYQRLVPDGPAPPQ